MTLDPPVRTLLLIALAAVTAEGSRWRELSQLVPDHIFRHQHLQVRLAIVHHEGNTDKLGNDRTPASPRSDRFCRTTFLELDDLTVELRVYERPFFS